MKKRRIPLLLFWFVLQAGVWTGLGNTATLEGGREAEKITWKESLTGMEFIWIPEGCFAMGSPQGERGRSDDEGPVREVCVDGFWMGAREVSRGEFARFAAATDYRTDAERQGFSWVYTGTWSSRPGIHWGSAGFDQTDAHPVVHVSWNDAGAMARWLMEHHSGEFRLPTEAEWEYACRAGTETARFWGENEDSACEHSNGADRTAQDRFPAWVVSECEDGFIFTAPTGNFRPNGFGLFDMLGNVWEWVHDNYQEDAYKTLPSMNPLHLAPKAERVARGGSWNSKPDALRCANRDVLQTADRRSDDLGFRLIRKTGEPPGKARNP